MPLSQLASSPWPLSQPVGLSNIRHPAITSGHGDPQIPNPILHSSHYHGTETCQFPSSSSSSSVSANQPLLSNTQPATQRPKLVPIFTNKSLSRHINITKILAEKNQQKQKDTPCPSRAAVKRPSCSPLSSAPSLPRVSLPFFKDRKTDHHVCTTTPAQPLFQTQPAPVTEVKTRVRRTPPPCILHYQYPYICATLECDKKKQKVRSQREFHHLFLNGVGSPKVFSITTECILGIKN